MALTIRPGLTGIIGRAARRLARTSTVLYLAGSLPGSWRAYLQRRLSRLRRIANVYDYATRLEFADSAGPGSRRFRVVVYGAFFEIWNAALVEPTLWGDVAGVVEVLRAADRSSLNLPAPLRPDICTVIIPLGEEHYRDCPPRCLSLVPDARSVATLSNKASFAAYIDELDLAKLCPKNYGRIEDVEFPVVLKRVDLAGSIGVEFVHIPAVSPLCTSLQFSPFLALLSRQGTRAGREESLRHPAQSVRSLRRAARGAALLDSLRRLP